MKPEFKPRGLSPWLPLIHYAKLPPEGMCKNTNTSPVIPAQSHPCIYTLTHSQLYTYTHRHRSTGPTLHIQTPLTLVQTEPLKTHAHIAAHRHSYMHTSTTHIHMGRDTLAMCSHTPYTPARQAHVQTSAFIHTHAHRQTLHLV